MSNYIKHLQEISNPKSFQRKKDYINYNLKEYLAKIGFKNLRVLEVGPGLGEFESFLNERGVSDIDIVDNDRGVLNYVSGNNKIRNAFLITNILDIGKRMGEYNFIFLKQVLEHLSPNKYAATLKILYEHLIRGGFLIFVVPNGDNPLGLVERYADLQHTNCFTEQSLKDLINLANLKNYQIEIKGYEIPPFTLINLLRIFLQKLLHFILLLIIIINGGVYFKIMTPNIMMIIRKTD